MEYHYTEYKSCKAQVRAAIAAALFIKPEVVLVLACIYIYIYIYIYDYIYIYIYIHICTYIYIYRYYRNVLITVI